ncbi:MAG TPA: hypothetical protein VF171_01600 [Trueperaceae bacterium]
MAVKFSELLADERFEVKNRRVVKALYEETKEAVAKGELALEGHSLPTTMNAWIAQVEPGKKPLARDYDVVDFSFADDDAFVRWQRAHLERKEQGTARSRTVYVSPKSKELLNRVQELGRAHEQSLLRGNAKKEDVVSALSDLQAAVYEFLSSYDEVQGALRLPDRRLPPDKVKVKKAGARKAKR